MLTAQQTVAGRVRDALLERNRVCEAFFTKEARRLAEACHEMSDRFLAGGRLIAFGRGACATDAQHVSVEFVHPVIVGKRALPAIDISPVGRAALEAIARPEDIVMGFAPPAGDPEIDSALRFARARGCLTFALPGEGPAYAFQPAVADDFLQQEIIEILYHTLWETVHVFFERRELGHDAGDAAFLYPFLGQEKQSTAGLVEEVASSIQAKVAEDARLRSQVSVEADRIADTAAAINACLKEGGKLILFGNGGSATDANDWAIDCVLPPPGIGAVPAISLAVEPAIITALANDVGTEVIFLRQLIAHAQSHDVAVGISTSGGSRNIIAALEEAHRRHLLTIALLGYDGGEIVRRGLADHALVVHCDYIPRIQEVQASIYHIMRGLLEARDAAN